MGCNDGKLCFRLEDFANQLKANCALTANYLFSRDLRRLINSFFGSFPVLNSTLKTFAWRMKASVRDNSPARELSYGFGLYVLDPGDGTLTRDSVRVRVQEQPFQLLLLLVERAGQIVSREEIRNRLWPQNTFVEFDKSLGVAVLKVREALGDDASNPSFIETIPRRGYRFIAPVKVETAHVADSTTPTPAAPTVSVPTLTLTLQSTGGPSPFSYCCWLARCFMFSTQGMGLRVPQPRPGPQSLEYTCVVRSQCSASAICLADHRTIGSPPLSAKC